MARRAIRRTARPPHKTTPAPAPAEAAADVATMHLAEPPAPASASPSYRPDPRPEPRREEDSRARAARRAAELSSQIYNIEEQDEFFVPPDMIPDGWSYEWKRKTTLGAEDPAYQVGLAQTGWEAVPVGRHPAFMPPGWKGAIERKGMVLMERPEITTDKVKANELKKARLQVRHKEEQLNAVPQGQFERRNKDASLVKVGKSYEAMPVPE